MVEAASAGAAQSVTERRRADALAVRTRLLDSSCTARECLAWLPPTLRERDAIGVRALNAAGVKRHYKLLSILLHPDKHADEPEEERQLWTEAHKRLSAARSTLLSAMGCSLACDDDEDGDDEEARELLSAGRYGEATTRYRKRAAELTKEFGPCHARTCRTKLHLASVLRTCTNQTGEAEVLLRWLQRSTRRTLGPDSVDYLQSVQQLGQLLHDKGDLAAAEPLLREGAEGLTIMRGERDEGALSSRAAYASLLLAKGDYQEAEPRLREVRDTSVAALGEAELTQRCRMQYSRCLEAICRTADDASAYVC